MSSIPTATSSSALPKPPSYCANFGTPRTLAHHVLLGVTNLLRHLDHQMGSVAEGPWKQILRKSHLGSSPLGVVHRDTERRLVSLVTKFLQNARTWDEALVQIEECASLIHAQRELRDEEPSATLVEVSTKLVFENIRAIDGRFNALFHSALTETLLPRELTSIVRGYFVDPLRTLNPFCFLPVPYPMLSYRTSVRMFDLVKDSPKGLQGVTTLMNEGVYLDELVGSQLLWPTKVRQGQQRGVESLQIAIRNANEATLREMDEARASSPTSWPDPAPSAVVPILTPPPLTARLHPKQRLLIVSELQKIVTTPALEDIVYVDPVVPAPAPAPQKKPVCVIS